jgi:hypothetical protein
MRERMFRGHPSPSQGIKDLTGLQCFDAVLLPTG